MSDSSSKLPSQKPKKGSAARSFSRRPAVWLSLSLSVPCLLVPSQPLPALPHGKRDENEPKRLPRSNLRHIQRPNVPSEKSKKGSAAYSGLLYGLVRPRFPHLAAEPLIGVAVADELLFGRVPLELAAEPQRNNAE